MNWILLAAAAGLILLLCYGNLSKRWYSASVAGLLILLLLSIKSIFSQQNDIPQSNAWEADYQRAEFEIAGKHISSKINPKKVIFAYGSYMDIDLANEFKISLKKGLGNEVEVEEVRIQAKYIKCTAEEIWSAVNMPSVDAVVYCGSFLPPYPDQMLEDGGPKIICCRSSGDYLLPLMESGRIPFFTGMQASPLWDSEDAKRPQHAEEAFSRRYRLIDAETLRKMVAQGESVQIIPATPNESN